MSFSKRLKELRTHLFGSRGQKHFSDYVGLPQSSLGKYEKNVSPSISAIERIIKRSGCNPAWLLLGEGDMFESKMKNPEKIKSNVNTIKHLGKQPSIAFDWATVGFADKTEFSLCSYNDNFFSLEITGDVLAPQIIEGDLCIFEKVHIEIDESEFNPMNSPKHDSIFKLRFYPFNRKIVMLKYDNITEIRYLYVDIHRKTLILMPVNIKYTPTTISYSKDGEYSRGTEKIEKVEVIAEIKTVVRDFRQNNV